MLYSNTLMHSLRRVRPNYRAMSFIESGSDLLELPMSPAMLSFANKDFLYCEKEVISYSITLVDLSQSKASILFASKSIIIAMSFNL